MKNLKLVKILDVVTRIFQMTVNVKVHLSLETTLMKGMVLTVGIRQNHAVSNSIRLFFIVSAHIQ
jgi:hypothetical protein